MIFRKKEKDIVLERKNAIEKMVQEISIIMEMAKDNEQIVDKLKVLQEKIKFMVSSSKKEDIQLEEKFLNKLGDLKIEIIKDRKRGSYESAETLIEDLEILFVSRNKSFN